MTITIQDLQEWLDVHYPDAYEFPKLLSYWLNKYMEECGVSNRELLEFSDNSIIITVFVDENETLNKLKDVWNTKVSGFQAPLIGGYKNGFSVFIPWILEDDNI